MFAAGVLCWFLTAVIVGDGAKILGIVPTLSRRHQEAFQPIWRALSLRGHEVTVLTTDPFDDPKLVNLTEINLHSLYNSENKDGVQLNPFNYVTRMFSVLKIYKNKVRRFLLHPHVQALLENEEKMFDVVMIEYSPLPLVGFARRFNAPLIVLTSTDAPDDLLSFIGNPVHPIVYPNPYYFVENNWSLYNRLKLAGNYAFMMLFRELFVNKIEQEIIEEHFGANYPPPDQLKNQISLVLANSNPIFYPIKNLLPTVIQFDGRSYENPSEPLPHELQNVLDDAQNGFIYFNLDSTVNKKNLPQEKIDMMLETLSELPYTVLWDFQENLSNTPKNVIISNRCSPQHFLEHPKIILFITYGSPHSTIKAFYAHVPMIGIPFFDDQRFIVNRMVEQGFALFLDYKTLQKDEFKSAILEVIGKPKYRSRVKELAEIALDQPMTGIEKAIWWTEYVIRYNGTKHLRSPLVDIPFYQYYMLDVGLAFLSIVIISMNVFVWVLKLLLKLIRKPKMKIKKS